TPADTLDCVTFHAGTAREFEQTLTSGGRVLCVTALAPTLKQAQTAAYQHIHGIQFNGMQYRTDIGYRAIELI
ncbi:MAG: phosphoribosylglycinamide synthetase C domain-containing protein, partial [Formosimonas sp.]